MIVYSQSRHVHRVFRRPARPKKETDRNAGYRRDKYLHRLEKIVGSGGPGQTSRGHYGVTLAHYEPVGAALLWTLNPISLRHYSLRYPC